MNVVLIGSGNTAQVLGRKIATRHCILQVMGRRLPQALATQLQADAITEFSQLSTKADVYLLAVSDGAVATLASGFPEVGGIIAHTAGALPLQVLAGAGKHYGVLYPLQSLRKEKTAYATIPFLVDGNTPMVKQALFTFAQTLSTHVAEAGDEQRLKLHTAAVVVSNFTNHLYALAENFCRREGVDFRLLHPLIAETAERLQQFSPGQMQTGPAARGDEATIYRHLQVLENHPALQHLYQVLTHSIQTMDNE